MFDDLHDPHPPAATPQHLAAVAERAERRRHRRTAAVMGVSTALLVAGGTTVLALREPADNSTTPTLPAAVATAAPTAAPPATTAPAATTVPTDSPTPTDSSTTTATPTTAPPPMLTFSREPGQPAPDELVALSATIAERARSVQAFGGRVEQSSACCGGTVTPSPARDVVFRGDGSMWTTDELGGWAAFDATTGVSRLAFRATADDPLQYQEIVGWNENMTGENVLLGFSPVTDVAGFTGDLTITEEPYPAIPERPAWRIEQHTELRGPVLNDIEAISDDVVYWIDQATGLTLALDRTQTRTSPSGESEQNHQSSRLTTFSTDAVLPPEFPGTFPPDAAVSRSGDPTAFSGAMTEAELAAAFGPGLLVPDPPGAARSLDVRWLDVDPNGQPVRDDGTATHVGFRFALGFQRVTIAVDRALTSDPPTGSPATGTVAEGALAGLSIYPAEYGGYVVYTQVDDWSITVTVTGAPSIDQAAELLGTVRPPTA